MTDTSTPELPIVWENPKDAELRWGRDRAHSPEATRPLSGSFPGLAAYGFTKAFEHFSVPVKALHMKVMNGYLYSSVEPLDVPEEELLRMAKEAESKIAEVMPQIAELWQGTYLPEIKQLLGELEAFDLEGASIDGLLAHWDRVYEIQRRLYVIHFLILLPSMLAISEFDELHRKLFETDDPHAAYRLIQGFDNLTLETGRALWELSRKALDQPEVMRVIKEENEANLMSALERFDAGREFAAELRSYLDYYGQRGDKWDISYPSWIEDPTPVIRNLKQYVRQDSHPAADLDRAAAERERLVAEARERLNENPMLPIFEFLLKAAQEGVVISEDHGFWIDFRGGHQLRRFFVELGRRFAEAGVVDCVDDVFYLYPDEIFETARALPSTDRHDLVAERKGELERFASVTPPLYIGAEGSSIPDDNPIARAFNKFGSERPATPQATDILGNPGAPGTVRGTARIIRTIADADRLEPGDVLVAETTSPPWTPLFAIASAVVTDSGGVLGHCAVVAREYGIPAVVGCDNATRSISDGQTVEVDGTEGVVRVVP